MTDTPLDQTQRAEESGSTRTSGLVSLAMPIAGTLAAFAAMLTTMLAARESARRR